MVEGLTVAVVGLGNVGKEVAVKIAEIQLPEDSKYAISRLLLFSTDQEKAGVASLELDGLAPNMSSLEIDYAPLEKLSSAPEFMPNIVINCASEKKAKETKDRKEMGRINLALNRRISEKIPDDALEIIVTNHILSLSQDAVATVGRNPALTIGCAQIDSIRAAIIIKKYLRDNNSLKGPFDKSNIFIIGSHDDNEMIFAYKTSTVNSLSVKELSSLAGRFLNIERFATEFPQLEIKKLGSTKRLTARAVVDTLLAVLTEKSYVSAGILCDFTDDFFRAVGKDYHRFPKPECPVYLAMRTGFENLKAGFFAGEDKNPPMRWFIDQAEETKEAFYRVAMKQHEYLKVWFPELMKI